MGIGCSCGVASSDTIDSAWLHFNQSKPTFLTTHRTAPPTVRPAVARTASNSSASPRAATVLGGEHLAAFFDAFEPDVRNNQSESESEMFAAVGADKTRPKTHDPALRFQQGVALAPRHNLSATFVPKPYRLPIRTTAAYYTEKSGMMTLYFGNAGNFFNLWLVFVL